MKNLKNNYRNGSRTRVLRSAGIRFTGLLALIALAAGIVFSSTASAGSLQDFFSGVSHRAAAVFNFTETKSLTPALPQLTEEPVFVPQTSTNALVEAREGHTATDLGDGKILLVGGNQTGAATAEILNSALPVPSSTTIDPACAGAANCLPRAGHTATKLSDGSVLIVGGQDANGNAVQRAVVFNPSNNQFSEAAFSLINPRSGHSATRLADGRILIAGGDQTNRAELLDPAAGTVAYTEGAMGAVRYNHSAALLLDGKVLLVGGKDAAGQELDSAEVFDGSNFAATVNQPAHHRVQPLLRVLPDGKVQIIGGNDDESMEVYDPNQTGGIFGAHGHAIPESDSNEHATLLKADILNAATRAALIRAGSADAALDRAGHTITEVSGSTKAIVAGGSNTGGALNTISVFNSSNATITTDKLDYQPGQTAVLSGTGWQAGETVNIIIHEDPHTHTERRLSPVADADGNFTVNYLIENHDLNVNFIVGAKGALSRKTAQTTFTDSQATVNGTVFSSAGGIVSGASISCTSGCNNPSTVTSSGTGIYSIQPNFNGGSQTITITAGKVGYTTQSLTFSVNNNSTVSGKDFTLTPTTVSTTTSVSSSVNPSTFGTSVTFTASVSAGSTPVTTGSVTFIEGGTCALPASTLAGPTAVNVSGQASFSTSALSVASHTITACYTGDASFASSNGNIVQSITKANQSITFGALGGKTFGDPDFTVSATAGSNLTVSFEASGNCTVSGTTVHLTGAGNCTITAKQAGDANYNAATDVAQSFTIAKAAAAINVVGYTGVYDGAAHGATGTATGINSEDLSSLLNFGDSFTNVPGGTANWSFAGNDNYNSANGTAAITISKADAVVNVAGYSNVYDGAAHGATGTATGVGGADLSSSLNLGATFTDVPGGTANWTFTGGTNYNDQNGTAAIVITKADAAVSVSGYTGTYDGAPHGATGTATGVGGVNLNGQLDLGASFTNVPGGTASWSFSGGTNYKNASGTVEIAIGKANANCAVNGYTGTYDGAAHGASGSCSGVGSADLSGSLDLGASFTNVPGGTANWTFTDATGNYNNTGGSAEIAINKATATINVVGFTGTYDGLAHGATGTATGVGSENLNAGLNFGDSFTNAPGGTANWTFTGGTNYNDANGAVEIVINKADAVCSITGYSGVYNGAPHGATGSCTGVGGSADVLSGLNLGNSFTDVPGGTASWSFSGGTNYNAQSGAVEIAITKAAATINVQGYTGVYDGAAHGATGSAIGVNSEDLSAGLNLGATFTNVPGGTANWSFAGGVNYNDANGAVAIDISKADAVCVVNGYTGTYDGLAHGASGSCSGVGSVDLTSGLTLGASFTNAPGGTANWTFAGGTNYADQNGTAAIIINKADASVSVNGYTGTYDGNAHGASGTATGVNGENLSALLSFGDSFTNVPGGTANWSFAGNGNYNSDGGTAAIVINKADATVSVSGYSGTYDGAPHGATGTATGAGGADLSAQLDLGAKFTSVPGGTANWSFSGGTNYNSVSGTAAITIGKAAATIVVTPYSVTYDANPHTAAGTATGVGGESLSGLDLSGTTHTNAGTYNGDAWTFTDSTGNYQDASGTVDNSIGKADAAISVSGYTGIFDGAAHGATGSATGVGNVDLSSLLDLGASFTNVPGGTVNWTFAGNGNYNSANGTANIVINKASSTTTVTGGGTYVFDNLPHPASVSVTGAGGLSLNPAPVYSGSCSAAPVTVAQTPCTAGYVYPGDANHTGSSGSAVINITAIAAAASVTVSPASQQYSDKVSFTATITPGFAGGAAAATTVTFYVGSQAMNSTPIALTAAGGSLTATLSDAALLEGVAGQMSPGSKTVTAVFGGVNPNFSVNTPSTSLAITKEDARATYTGAVFASTSGATSTTATVTLSATIQDITATADAAGDTSFGDIRNAKVTFVNRDSGAVLASNLPVGLAAAGDTKTGTATANVSLSVGSCPASPCSQSYTIGVIVDGYYTRNNSTDNTVVTVAQPGSNFITGGGYLLMYDPTRSSGLYPGGAGTKNNFGFNVKYNKSGTNLQGSINTIIRNNGRVYQIKGNSMTSLSVNATTGKATFNGKASIQDITDPLSVLPIDGNATLQVVMTDKGEPGNLDSIAITVWNKSGGMWFSSNWDGVKTLEQLLGSGTGNGNLSVK